MFRSGRFFFVAQWIVPPLTVVVLLFGRGWATDLADGRLFAPPLEGPDADTAIALLLGVVVVAPAAVAWAVLLWLPAVLTLADGPVGRMRRTRLAYSVSAAVAWVAAVPGSLGVAGLWHDAGLRDFTVVPLVAGGPSLDPGLEVAGVVGAGVGVAAWAASVLFAIAGAIIARVRPLALDAPRWLGGDSRSSRSEEEQWSRHPTRSAGSP